MREDGRGRTRRPRAWIALSTVAVLAATMLVAAGCGGDDDDGGDAGAGGPAEKVEFLLSYQRSIAFIGEIMAQENGYFADEGLEIEPVPTEGGQFVNQQLIAGNNPFGLTGAENVDIAASQGEPLESIYEADRDIILIGAPADGDVDSVDDLAGNSLGITDPGGGEVNLVNAVLEAEGLTDSVDTPAVGPGGPAVYQALQSGEIAAYAGYTNDLAGVEAAGLELVDILPEEFQGFPSNVFALGPDASEEDRDTLATIARAWTRGTIDALNDPQGALDIACEDYVPEECQDPAVAAAFMNATLQGIVPREGKPIGEFDYESLERQGSILAQRDLGPDPIDYETVFTNEFIEEINDFDEPQLEEGVPELLDVEAASVLGKKGEQEGNKK